jgi:glycine/D-amino acid oxidase-like deaminating enzyme
MKVAIVGGGVIGLATADALVAAECDVILTDKQDISSPN